MAVVRWKGARVWQARAEPTIAAMSPARAEILGFTPDSRVRGSFRPAGSKSLAQRALLAAAVARGTTSLAGLPAGEDVDAARALVAALGAGRAAAGARTSV